MTQSIMLHHLLRTPSESYHTLSTQDQLEKLMKKQAIVKASDADQWFDEAWDALFETVESVGVNRALFEPLYIERDLVKHSSILNWETDTQILNTLKAYQSNQLGETYAKIKIDFYNLKRVLMFKRAMNLVATGFIDQNMLDTYGSDINGLIHNSVYHDVLESLDLKNVEMLERKVLTQAMEPYRMDGNSDDGLFSKMYFKINELIELRARMKAMLFNIELSQVVLAYE